MANWLEEQLHQAMATLTAQRDRIEEAKAELATRTSSVTSTDHMVTVTVDANNKVVGLKFNTTKYRSMHPDQLAQVLLEVLGTARQQMADTAAEVFGPLLDARTDLRAAMAGNTEVDAMFAPVWGLAPTDPFGRKRD